MRFKPVNSQIILKLEAKGEDWQSVGGIIISNNMIEKPHQAIVYLSDHDEYKTGDVVLYRKYSGFEFKYDDTEYLVIEGTDVLVKLIQE
jgi:co-chaperonin GroES (HSP10)